jgi:hypothetical protein
MKTIDITPTWSALILPMVEVLKNPKADPQAKKEIQAELLRLPKIAMIEVLKNPKAPAEAKKEATDEFIRLAKIVDDQNEEAKQNG